MSSNAATHTGIKVAAILLRWAALDQVLLISKAYTLRMQRRPFEDIFFDM